MVIKLTEQTGTLYLQVYITKVKPKLLQELQKHGV